MFDGKLSSSLVPSRRLQSLTPDVMSWVKRNAGRPGVPTIPTMPLRMGMVERPQWLQHRTTRNEKSSPADMPKSRAWQVRVLDAPVACVLRISRCVFHGKREEGYRARPFCWKPTSFGEYFICLYLCGPVFPRASRVASFTKRASVIIITSQNIRNESSAR